MTTRAACRRAVAGEACYPDALLDLPEPPRAIHWAGAAWPPARRAVAVVGARGASAYGRERARALGAELGDLGITVVSGLARGIDAAAHEGALAGGAPPVAVVAADPSRSPLRETAALYERLLECGAVCAEFGPGTPAKPGLFLRRNRLVAALSRVVVVVEAGERSGALATAEWARRLGRAVAAVPGDVTRENARGVLRLLQTGAHPVADGSDVMALFERVEAAPPSLEAALIELLGSAGPLTAEGLAARGGQPAEAIRLALVGLELSGRVRRVPGGRFEASHPRVRSAS